MRLANTLSPCLDGQPEEQTKAPGNRRKSFGTPGVMHGFEGQKKTAKTPLQEEWRQR
jgi:hypothetical protein